MQDWPGLIEAYRDWLPVTAATPVITLREVRADDQDAIAAGFEALSPESRYRRFFTAMSLY